MLNYAKAGLAGLALLSSAEVMLPLLRFVHQPPAPVCPQRMLSQPRCAPA